MGWLALVIGIGLAVFINFLVGHFRDLTATISWNDAAGAAFGRVVAGHVQMQSLDAWLLTGLGMLIAAFAGWKAYGALDPYPDYGRVSDNFDKKRREWQELREETFNALIETRDEAADKLNDECDKLRESFDDAKHAREGLLTLAGRRRDFLRECDRVAGDLLAVYREANRKARSAPEPAYFRQGFHFDPEPEPDDPAPLDPEAVQQAVALVEEAVERIIGPAKAPWIRSTAVRAAAREPPSPKASNHPRTRAAHTELGVGRCDGCGRRRRNRRPRPGAIRTRDGRGR